MNRYDIKVEDITQEQLDRLIGIMTAYAAPGSWKTVKRVPCEYEWDDKIYHEEHIITEWIGGIGSRCSYHGAELAQECLRGGLGIELEDYFDLKIKEQTYDKKY